MHQFCAVARQLLLFAMTAAMLALAGCGDSGEDSDDDASPAGRRAPRSLFDGSTVPDQRDRVSWGQLLN
jgi:hypothetical protein